MNITFSIDVVIGRPGDYKDQDIYDWWQAQPKAKRSEIIRQAIRAQIDKPSLDLYQAFSDMRKYLDDKFSKIGSVTIQGGEVEPTADDGFRLTEEQVRQREDKIRKDTKKKW